MNNDMNAQNECDITKEANIKGSKKRINERRNEYKIRAK